MVAMPAEPRTAVEQLSQELLSRWMTVEHILEEVDGNGDGTIDLDEFKHLVLDVLHLNIDDEELQQVFAGLDKDGDGTCSKEELSSALSAYHAGAHRWRTHMASHRRSPA
jgi:Ca2+-binding EF-hand superfamily protein